MKNYYILCFVFLYSPACQSGNYAKDVKEKSNQSTTIETKVMQVVSYGSIMSKAEKTMILETDLREISGLTFDASANELIAHNDELGVLYRINFEDDEVVAKEKIGNIGDYEGVEMVGDQIYLINSAGDFISFNQKTAESYERKTALNANNNVEGLAYYEDQLLIACKGKPEFSLGQNYPDCRAIYAYNLKSSALSRVPFMLICKEKLKSFLPNLPQEYVNRLNKFAPSGLAVHPSSHEIYILSHLGKLLVVLNPEAEVQKLFFLSLEEHKQPEGICFDSQNRLYIANEAKNGPAVIHRYTINQ